MGRLENEARTAMTVLLKQGHSQSAVARMLGVSEGTVRYHRRRSAAGAVDGRTTQVGKAAAVAEAIAHWRNQQPAGRVNLAALHDWLKGRVSEVVEIGWRRNLRVNQHPPNRRRQPPGRSRHEAEYRQLVLFATARRRRV